jgi:arogenate dehydrogenase (NADP+)
MRVGIIGLGLIGGSLGLDLRALGYFVWGVSRSAQTCQTAVDMGAVDFADPSLENIPHLSATDLIVICTPIAQVLGTVRHLAQLVQPPTIITDVASVKGTIVAPAQAIYDHFVGAHPMAGTAGQGIHSAQAGMFHDRVCVVCEGIGKEVVQSLWEQVGMEVLVCSAEAHDRAVAWISHLPVMISASLINSIANEEDLSIMNLAQKLASTGFRDTSRVGGGNPELGALMAEYNQPALLHSLKNYQRQLAVLTDLVEQNQWEALHQLLASAHHDRPLFDICRK